MISISLCMIVKNEEVNLANCLNCAKEFADEIIIIDTGSEDKTKKIARKFTDKIYDFAWVDDFAAARNFAFSKAGMEYQMWLDADDIIEQEEIAKINQLKKNLDPATDIVTMQYATSFDENRRPAFTYTRGRWFKRSKGFAWVDPVHEYIPLYGKIFNSDIMISHNKSKGYAGRNLKIYEKMIASGKELSPRSLYYYARELRDNGREEEAVEYFRRFLATKRGWIEDNITACNALGQCLSNLGKKEEALETWMRSFIYDTPRGEICCSIGYLYKERQDWRRAIFWFDLAAKLIKPDSMGFINHEYWDYIPFLELCVCYSKIGDIEKSIEHNDKAAEIRPNSAAVKYNKEYFASLKE